MNKKNATSIFFEGLSLMEKKNSDYAGRIDNISLTGLEGIAVRLIDKVARVYSLTDKKTAEVKNESIRDTLIDVMNYANIGIQILDGSWERNDNLSSKELMAHAKSIIISDDDGYCD